MRAKSLFFKVKLNFDLKLLNEHVIHRASDFAKVLLMSFTRRVIISLKKLLHLTHSEFNIIKFEVKTIITRLIINANLTRFNYMRFLLQHEIYYVIR